MNQFLSRTKFSTISATLAGILVVPTSISAWRQRPVPDLGETSIWHDGSHESSDSTHRETVPQASNDKTYDENADHDDWIKIGNIRHKDKVTHFLGTEEESLMQKYSRAVIMTFVTIGAKFIMNVMNDFEIVGSKKNYDFLMESILSRDPDVPLITVANHTSMIDDPGLMGALVGFKPIFQDKHRWGVCTQEICFKTALASSFIGAGKVLPIKRGEGVDQPLMSHLAYKVIRNEWLHIFPEAHIAQTGSLGRGMFANSRPDDRIAQIGSLKWGVGKLIAHSPSPPLVIPFYHVGMHQLVPMYNKPGNNHVVKPFRVLGGNRVTLRVGEPIDFSDLLEEYEKENGKLRKMSIQVGRKTSSGKVFDTLTDFGTSSAAERQLYSALTRRVEEALLKLERESESETAQCEWGENAKVSGKGTLKYFRNNE